ncbi:MAG: hypothetical protein KTR20_05750 [Cellvibrionaceae bacterium]|nr:hypothetical protein [Cellvibrionaceae bacterium]
MSIKNYLMALPLALSLIACGGSGDSSSASDQSTAYSGSRDQATVSVDNVDALSKAAVEASRRVNSYGYGASGVFRSTQQADANAALVIAIVEQNKEVVSNKLASLLASAAAGRVVQQLSCSVSGSVVYDFVNVDENTTALPDSGTLITTYNHCDEGFGDSLNGTVTFVWDGYDATTDEFFSESATFDLVITEDGFGPMDVSGVYSCTNYRTSCTYTEYFTEGGVRYGVENLSVSGSDDAGYTMSARVYHEEFGYTDIVATAIIFCPNGNIQSGSIAVTDSSQTVVLNIVFSNCDEYTLSYEGVSSTYPQ